MPDVRNTTSLTASADRRIAHEKQLLEQARTELKQGLYVDGDDVEAWLDAIDSEDSLPLPKVRERKA